MTMGTDQAGKDILIVTYGTGTVGVSTLQKAADNA
jgi:hypothetical protein